MASDLKKSQIETVAESNSLFALAFHDILKDKHPGNLVFCPYSLSVLLAIAKLGARGKTADEIIKGCKFPVNDETLARGYSQVQSFVKKAIEDVDLYVSSKVICPSGFEIKKDFPETVKYWFSSDVEQFDYKNNARVGNRINNWIEEATNSKIRDLHISENLDFRMVLLFLSGAYFKGLWKYRFDPEMTAKVRFHVKEKITTEVFMMHGVFELHYTLLKSLNCHALLMPFRGDRVCMLLYLPKDQMSFGALEGQLNRLLPGDVVHKMNKKTVHVSLPRFSILSDLRLKDQLKKLGVQSMFIENGADFTRIPNTKERYMPALFASEVAHKVFIEVDEEGSIEISATEMLKVTTSASGHRLPSPIIFNANHPFIFQVLDRLTNYIFFQGCCKNPEVRNLNETEY